MAFTLAEAEKYTTNKVKRGVIKEIIKDSAILRKLPFIDVVGNAYQYLRETVLPTAESYEPGEVWAESTHEVTQFTAKLKIIGGDADVDNFLKATRSDKTDLQAETIDEKAKAVRHRFLTLFYYGDNAANSKEFDGLHKAFLGADMTNQVIHEGSGAVGSPLNASNVDLAMDLVRDTTVDCIIGTRHVRRRLAQYLRGKANVIYEPVEYGRMVPSWNGTPWEYDDFLNQTETIAGGAYSSATGGATSTLFFLTFGAKGVQGLQNGGLEVIRIGQVQSKDAFRVRIRWYVSIAVLSAIREAAIDGITDAAMAD